MALPPRIDKRAVTGKPKVRSKAHRDWVSSHRCCVPGCTDMPIDCAHVRRAANAGTGFKPSDAFTVSLCHAHHMESHRGEQTFEKKYRINLMGLAREFFDKSPHRRKLDSPYV